MRDVPVMPPARGVEADPTSARPLRQQLVGLAGWLFVTFAAAAVGAVASSREDSFYAQLELPGWAPPGWLFAPVWSVLYLAMGVAAWLVWRSTRDWRLARLPLALYLLQLAANSLWTWLFFAGQRGSWAFAEALLLALLITVTLAAFRRYNLSAALLLAPIWDGCCMRRHSRWQAGA